MLGIDYIKPSGILFTKFSKVKGADWLRPFAVIMMNANWLAIREDSDRAALQGALDRYSERFSEINDPLCGSMICRGATEMYSFRPFPVSVIDKAKDQPMRSSDQHPEGVRSPGADERFTLTRIRSWTTVIANTVSHHIDQLGKSR